MEAIQLLEDTFKDSFSREKFSKFIKEIFNNFELTPKTWDVWKEYKDHIDSLELIGSYENKRRNIDVLVVKIKKSKSIERARTMQRNFVAKYLANTEKDAALVAFYYEEDPDWRFSFVKMEYKINEDSKGRTKVEQEITPAKRYSFLVGPNEPNHTCKQQFLELVMEEKNLPSLEILESAFSIDKVTNDFFNEYKELYLKLKESLDKVIQTDSHVRKEFEKNGISSVDFSKKLLGQIVFLYFLQKKGWLGVQRSKDGFKPWGSGMKNFLRKLFDKEILPYKNFFNDILEPLFYEALSTQRDEEYYSKFNCRIPFLNGGLFEPIGNYDWVITDILLDNSVFQNILDTFDRYNFTIKEDEPLEKEVAVDPEMLGKVFEKLLEIKERKDKGKFYTPREIVHEMSQQSLINYLNSNTEISREEIEKFIKFGENTTVLPNSIIENRDIIDLLLKTVKIIDPAVGSGAFPIDLMNKIVKARSLLTPFFQESERKERTDYNFKRETIEKCLYGVDIDSSAIDIAKLRFWLSLIVDELDIQNIRPLPNLDHKIMVGDSLIEEFEGTPLFDDSLLVESEKNNSMVIHIDEEINKLYLEIGKIHQGIKASSKNSIKKIAREIKKLKLKKKKILHNKENMKQVTLEDSMTIRIKQSKIKLSKLKELHKRFFNEQNRRLKKQCAEQIDSIEWELIEETLKEQGNEKAMKKLKQYKKLRSKPFFLWKLYFSEVFQQANPGFDIVIANPPYVRQEKIKDYKKQLDGKYSIFQSTADLYTYFYELGIRLIREKGNLTFITSNKFMRAKYGFNLRRFLKHNTSIEQVIDFGDEHKFEAITNTSVLITNKGYREKNIFTYDSDIKEQKFNPYKQDNLDDSAWTLESDEILFIKNKIKKDGLLLGEWDVNINRGITTGENKAFVIDTKTKEKLCREDSKNKQIIKPIIRGRNIEKYSYQWNDLWMIFVPWHFPLDKDSSISGASSEAEKQFKTKYTSLYKHLQQYKEGLSDRNKDDTNTGYEWYALQRFGADYYQDFSKEKIIWIELSSKNRFAYSTKEEYILAGAFLMTGKSLKYLLAFLNSSICQFYFPLISNSSGMATVQWKPFSMERIPIRKLDAKEQKPFIELVDKILEISKKPNYLQNTKSQAQVKNLQENIDNLFYNLYNLTPKEILTIKERCEK